MALSPLAGKPAPKEILVDLPLLERDYFERRPDPDDPAQQVSFGTSGHRGTSLRGSFNEPHILAITQAICDYRHEQTITGPLYMGKDTHALSGPAQRTALEVLAANDVPTVIQRDDGFTPTPAISHAILVHNRGRSDGLADGIVITPSHNPPEDGGFKYNPPNGGPADTDVTKWIEARANALLRGGNAGVKRLPLQAAISSETTHQRDLMRPYVEDLRNVIDMDAIRGAKLALAVDPLGGAAAGYWDLINSIYGLDIAVTNPQIDPSFSFMTVDHDGAIRMDCSSPYAMARLVGLKDRYRVAFANDPDSDRHGIVTPSAGLMNPNHYLAVAIDYLLTHRPDWPADAAVGKTAGQQRHDRSRREQAGPPAVRSARGLQVVCACIVRRLVLLRRRGERRRQLPAPRRQRVDDRQGRTDHEPAGRRDHRAHRPGSGRALRRAHGANSVRPTTPASTHRRRRNRRRSWRGSRPNRSRPSNLAGEPILLKLTHAPGNNAPIGGLKVVTSGGWFAARPSGTEAVYKIYAESFRDERHLQMLVSDAQQIVQGT